MYFTSLAKSMLTLGKMEPVFNSVSTHDLSVIMLWLSAKVHVVNSLLERQ